MGDLAKWANEKKCCCTHPDRMACAEDQQRRSLPADDVLRSLALMDEFEPCECPCHEFDDEDDYDGD